MNETLAGKALPFVLSSGATGNKGLLFALQATADLGKTVALNLGCELASHEERSFEDGEHKVRPLGKVAGTDVYIVQSLHSGRPNPPMTSSAVCCSSSVRLRTRGLRALPRSCRISATPAKTAAPSPTIR